MSKFFDLETGRYCPDVKQMRAVIFFAWVSTVSFQSAEKYDCQCQDPAKEAVKEKEASCNRRGGKICRLLFFSAGVRSKKDTGGQEIQLSRHPTPTSISAILLYLLPRKQISCKRFVKSWNLLINRLDLAAQVEDLGATSG